MAVVVRLRKVLGNLSNYHANINLFLLTEAGVLVFRENLFCMEAGSDEKRNVIFLPCGIVYSR